VSVFNAATVSTRYGLGDRLTRAGTLLIRSRWCQLAADLRTRRYCRAYVVTERQASAAMIYRRRWLACDIDSVTSIDDHHTVDLIVPAMDVSHEITAARLTMFDQTLYVFPQLRLMVPAKSIFPLSLFILEPEITRQQFTGIMGSARGW
jgi:hypothetical protein